MGGRIFVGHKGNKLSTLNFKLYGSKVQIDSEKGHERRCLSG